MTLVCPLERMYTQDRTMSQITEFGAVVLIDVAQA